MKEILIFIFWVVIRIGPGLVIAFAGLAGNEWNHGVVAGCGFMLVIMGVDKMIKEVME